MAGASPSCATSKRWKQLRCEVDLVAQAYRRSFTVRTEEQIHQKIKQLESMLEEQNKIHPADQSIVIIDEAIDGGHALRWVLDERMRWRDD